MRLKHPTTPGLYYSGATNTWVERGYTRWTRAEWTAKFGRQETDNRQWEYFGWIIPLSDDEPL